jgi:hypothetical protein
LPAENWEFSSFSQQKKNKSTSKYVDFTTDIMGAAGLTACVYIYAPLSAA